MKRVILDTLNKVDEEICPYCAVTMKKEIDKHSLSQDFVVYHCANCDMRFTYLAEEE